MYNNKLLVHFQITVQCTASCTQLKITWLSPMHLDSVVYSVMRQCI